MTKKEYYQLSNNYKLPLRCPCLGTCARYRYTSYSIGRIYYNPRSQNTEDAMKEMDILSPNESLQNMLDVGEPMKLIGGSRSYSIFNGCPEFFLHPNQHKPMGMKDLAVHEYSFDKEYRDEKFIPGESKHYTECAEYALFSSRKPRKNTRKKVSQKMKAELQQEIESQCPFCSDKNVGHFHIHHIDENPENNKHENLLMLCPTCHSKITKHDILFDEVIKVKRMLNRKSTLIECASINIDGSNCSWVRYNEPNAFYDERNGKSRFPLVQFAIVNNSGRSVLFTEISLKAKHLPRGISGVPTPYKLKSLSTYKILIPEGESITKFKLDDEILIQQGEAIKFTTELYDYSDGKYYPPEGGIALYFAFKINDITVQAPTVFLNCHDEGSTISISHLD